MTSAPPPQQPEPDEGTPQFEDTHLGKLQREVFGEEMEWADFEKQALGMEWPEWVRVGGDISMARTRWSRWKSQQNKEAKT